MRLAAARVTRRRPNCGRKLRFGGPGCKRSAIVLTNLRLLTFLIAFSDAFAQAGGQKGFLCTSLRREIFALCLPESLSDWGSHRQAIFCAAPVNYGGRGFVPVGHSLLFAVGARPPHDGMGSGR